MLPFHQQAKPGRDAIRRSLLPCILSALAGMASADHGRHGNERQAYRIVPLVTGLLASSADINSRGQVSFSLLADKGATGYFYDGSKLHNIGSLGGTEVIAVDVNESGQVTGS
jgi:hypothetical protein